MYYLSSNEVIQLEYYLQGVLTEVISTVHAT